MSKDWVQDIAEMHTKYGFNEKIQEFDKETLQKFLQFRYSFLQEEMRELSENLTDPEEIVDAIIDLCVVAIGTLDAFEVDAYRAWDEVHKANMAKEVGVKETRPNPLGLPDLVKPQCWQAPSHEGNHGLLTKALK